MSSPASRRSEQDPAEAAAAAAAGQTPADEQLQRNKVYISHGKDTIAFVEALTARLESAGLQITATSSSSSSSPGQGLAESKTVVVVISDSYVYSAEGIQELESVCQSKQCRQDQNLLPVCCGTPHPNLLMMIISTVDTREQLLKYGQQVQQTRSQQQQQQQQQQQRQQPPQSQHLEHQPCSEGGCVSGAATSAPSSATAIDVKHDSVDGFLTSLANEAPDRSAQQRHESDTSEQTQHEPSLRQLASLAHATDTLDTMDTYDAGTAVQASPLEMACKLAPAEGMPAQHLFEGSYNHQSGLATYRMGSPLQHVRKKHKVLHAQQQQQEQQPQQQQSQRQFDQVSLETAFMYNTDACSMATAEIVDAVGSVVQAYAQQKAPSDAGQLSFSSIQQYDDWLMSVKSLRGACILSDTLDPAKSSATTQDLCNVAPIALGMLLLMRLQHILALEAVVVVEKHVAAEQELEQLLLDAVEDGLLVRLQFEDDMSLKEQQAVFALLAEHNFFKLRTTEQGHVFATSDAIQSLYTGSAGNQPHLQQQQQQHQHQQHVSMGGSSAAALGTPSGLGGNAGLLGSGSTAQPLVAATPPGSSGSSDSCYVGRVLNLVAGVPQAESKVRAEPCVWQPSTADSARLVTFAGGKWTGFDIQASSQHSDVQVSFRVHVCVKASGSAATGREMCLTVEELCGKLPSTGQPPAAPANQPVSNPLGLLWVQLTVAAEEGGLPVILRSQQAHSACGLALQQFTEVPAEAFRQDFPSGPWYMEGAAVEGTASAKPNVKLGAAFKKARPFAPGDAKDLNVLVLYEVTRHLVPRGVSFQLIRYVENTARCQRDYDLDYAGMLTNNSISIKGELSQVLPDSAPPPIKLMVAVELAWAAEIVTEPKNKLSKVFKRAETVKPVRFVFSSSATADVEPTQLEGQC